MNSFGFDFWFRLGLIQGKCSSLFGVLREKFLNFSTNSFIKVRILSFESKPCNSYAFFYKVQVAEGNLIIVLDVGRLCVGRRTKDKSDNLLTNDNWLVWLRWRNISNPATTFYPPYSACTDSLIFYLTDLRSCLELQNKMN